MTMTEAKILEVRDWCVDNAINAGIIKDLTDLARTLKPREWTSYRNVPVGVPFTFRGGPGYPDIVMAKLQGGILLNFGSNADDRSVRVNEGVCDPGVLFTEFLGEVNPRKATP